MGTNKYYVIKQIGTYWSHDSLSLYKIWTCLVELFLCYSRNNPTSTNIWKVLSLTVVLSRISGSVDNIQEFMEKVDTDVRDLPSNSAVMNTTSTLGKVLQLTKNTIDQLSQVWHQWLCILTFIVSLKLADHGYQAHPILNASWTIVSSLYQVNCLMKCQANWSKYQIFLN